MENVSAGLKGGGEETPIFHLKCSDTLKTCSRAQVCSQVRPTGNIHSFRKERSRHPRSGQAGSKEYTEEDADLSGTELVTSACHF